MKLDANKHSHYIKTSDEGKPENIVNVKIIKIGFVQ